MGPVSHHNMPLVINSLRGGHTNTHTHTHTHANTHAYRHSGTEAIPVAGAPGLIRKWSV